MFQYITHSTCIQRLPGISKSAMHGEDNDPHIRVDQSKFLKGIDARVHDLTVTWHTFDLEAAREKSEAVLEELRAKREEVASAAKERNAENRGQSTQ